MWDFIREWLPVIAFLFGIAMGWLISTFFEKSRAKYLEDLYRSSQRNNDTLKDQISRKSGLEGELSRTNLKLEQLREQLNQMSRSQAQENKLDRENLNLRREVLERQTEKKEEVEKEEAAASKDYISDYQLFLQDLEKSVKKAQKIALDKADEDSNFEKTSKKKKSHKSKTDKFDFYKQKYDGKQFSIADLNGEKKSKDLTFLYGINKNIQELLNNQDIVSFSDLSNTTIAELKAILALAGDQYEDIDPLNWPIQARLAEKGKWEILDEYKRKMKM